MAEINGFRVWDEEYDREHFTQEEIAISDLQANIIASMVKARKEQGISQRKLAELSGIKQPVIARIEKGTTTPQINTLVKMLVALGKTIAVVPLDQQQPTT